MTEGQFRRQIEFRDLLTAAGLDPRAVKLIRHQGNHQGRTPWSLWLAHDGRFEVFQRIQSRRVLDVPHIASFVAMPDGRSLFVGVWSVDGCGTAPQGTIDPLQGGDACGKNYYDLSASDALADHVGSLVIRWSSGRRWDRWAYKPGYLIEEMHPSSVEIPFPGFLAFTSPISELPHLPPSWRQALASVSGVYLLVDTADGSQYVGSAYGSSGFLGRWSAYVETGHANNVRLKNRAPRDYMVTILEVTSSTSTWEQIVARETLWKTKLGSRAHGLNAN